MSPYKNKKCLVIGAGVSGEWAARLLLAEGAKVTISDQGSREALAPVAERLADEKIKWEFGGNKAATISGADLIVLSPGVPWSVPGLLAAQAGGTEIIGEMELAARFLKVPMAAVTGSNGKTTTTALLGRILENRGRKTFVGGNIGTPLSRFILEGQAAALAVLEVSSFQLETVKRFHAKAAACLNISPDHLDRYDDMAEYFRAKGRVFVNQKPGDLAVLNGDDALLRHKHTVARAFMFSRARAPEFGAAFQDGDIRVWDGGRLIAARPWADFSLWGAHNQENLMAAVGLAMGLGLGAQEALDAARDFKAEGHRLELVGEFGGVRYYDDSKGTNVGAVAAALESFSEKVVLIMGGRGKGLDFHALYGPVEKHVKRLVLIGEAKDELKAALGGAAPVSMAENMAEAVKISKNEAAPGEAVLLSPACASFDMFKNYKERGEAFVREVKALNHAG